MHCFLKTVYKRSTAFSKHAINACEKPSILRNNRFEQTDGKISRQLATCLTKLQSPRDA